MPVFKKGDPASKIDYRPMSTLSNFSKMFEKLIYLQLNNYIQNKSSIYLTGIQKNHDTQHALNMDHKVDIIYMDLSKAFDSLYHELLIAKLKCYVLDQHAVGFFRGYLSNRCPCFKTNNTLGDWRKIIAGAPQCDFYYSTYF